MTNSDLFWQLFTTSGHVGAYLLYSWYNQPPGELETDDKSSGDMSSPERAEGDESEMSMNRR